MKRLTFEIASAATLRGRSSKRRSTRELLSNVQGGCARQRFQQASAARLKELTERRFAEPLLQICAAKTASAVWDNLGNISTRVKQSSYKDHRISNVLLLEGTWVAILGRSDGTLLDCGKKCGVYESDRYHSEALALADAHTTIDALQRR